MLHLSKKVEYGLIAIRHIASQPVSEVITAKELSDKYQIPFDMLAKILQKLSKKGLIVSYQGVRGGYVLGRRSDQIKLSDVIYAIEGKQNVSLINCEKENPDSCNIYQTCTIKNPLSKIQNIINGMFDEMTISEIV